MLVQQGGVLGFEVAGAVLEAEEVPRGGLGPRGGGGPAEAQLGPADARLAESDAGQVPDRVDCHLRVVGAGLDHDVAAGASGLEIIAGEVRQVDECVRAASVQAEAGLAVLLEQARAEPEGEGELSGPQVQGLARVLGRGVVGAVDGARAARAAPGGHRLGGSGPVLQEPDELGAVLGDDVESCNVKAVLGRRDDAGLAVAVERDDVAGRRERSGRCLDGVVAEEACGQSGDGAGAARPCEGQQPTAGQPTFPRGGGRRRGCASVSRCASGFRGAAVGRVTGAAAEGAAAHRTTAEVSLASGSPKASTREASCWTSAWLSSL